MRERVRNYTFFLRCHKQYKVTYNLYFCSITDITRQNNNVQILRL